MVAASRYAARVTSHGPRGAVSRVVIGALATLVAVSAAAACTTMTSPWEQVDLPVGTTPVTVTDLQGTLLLGTLEGGRPAAMRRTDSGQPATWTPLTVTPASAYGKEAEWLGIAIEPGGGLVAVGGARGGAHSNVRWSVWRGDASTLSEQEQVFSTFGGWGAGEQLGPIATDAGSMLLGSWESAKAALDADIWLPQGAAWVRQSPAGTALESTPGELVGPRAGTAWGAGALVAGSVLHLGDGVRQTPAVWRSDRLNTGWRRIDLPDGGTAGEAVSAACLGPACVIAGWVDGTLALWRVDPTGARRVAGVPELAVGDRAVVPALLLDEEGRATLVLTDGGTLVVFRESARGWDRTPGPAGTVLQAARVADRIYAVVHGSDGTRTLWQRPW